MSPPRSWVDDGRPLVADASVWINIIAGGQAATILRTMARPPILPRIVLGELERGRDKGRATAERMAELIEMGLVHRLESLNAFVACAHSGESCCSHHGTVAFAICNACGHVMEFHDHTVEHRLSDWARGKGFKQEKTTIEIRGLCASCAAA